MRKRSTKTLELEQLDAVAAAPYHHRVIFENEQVRVLDTRIGPGETVPVHTHQWPSVVYTLETSDFVRFDAASGTMLDSRETTVPVSINTPIDLPPLAPHSIRNVGDTEMRAISVELKNIRGEVVQCS
jgi:mannose-6-phosphate isomerase-like protein (cupin superfamily)